MSRNSITRTEECNGIDAISVTQTEPTGIAGMADVEFDEIKNLKFADLGYIASDGRVD